MKCWVCEVLHSLDVIKANGTPDEREGLRRHIEMVSRTIELRSGRETSESSLNSIEPSVASLDSVDL